MNAEDVAKVLAKIRLGDNRETSREVLLEWIDNIGDLDFHDCIEAVRLHRRESTEYLTPAHVRAGVKRIRGERNPSNDTTPGGYQQIEALQGAPMPENMRELEAAWGDRSAWAVAVAKYDDQLSRAGFPPVGVRVNGRWQPGDPVR
jgi:hypothetical protein